MPLAATESAVACPEVMVCPCGCAVMAGAMPAGALTVIVAVPESAVPAAFDTRTQYSVVVVSAGVV